MQLSEFVGRMLGLGAVRLADLLERLDLGVAADTHQLLLQVGTGWDHPLALNSEGWCGRAGCAEGE